MEAFNASKPDFLPTIERIEEGLNSENTYTKTVFLARKDEWIAKLERQELRIFFIIKQ